MKQKRLFGLIVVVLLMGFVVAQNETSAGTTNDKGIAVAKSTEKEVAVMMEKHGATMRILQLQRAIERLILHAEEISAVLKEKGENTTELDALIEELKLILEEAKKLDPNSENAVEEFVQTKEDAIELRREIREAIKDKLSKEDKEKLRKRFREMDKSKMKEINEKIRRERRALNAERIKKIGELANIDVSKYVSAVENGKMNARQAMKELRKRYEGLSPSKRQEIRKRVKANLKKRDYLRMQRLSNAMKKRLREVNDGQRYYERMKKLRARGINLSLKDVEKRRKLILSNKARLQSQLNNLGRK